MQERNNRMNRKHIFSNMKYTLKAKSAPHTNMKHKFVIAGNLFFFKYFCQFPPRKKDQALTLFSFYSYLSFYPHNFEISFAKLINISHPHPILSFTCLAFKNDTLLCMSLPSFSFSFFFILLHCNQHITLFGSHIPVLSRTI